MEHLNTPALTAETIPASTATPTRLAPKPYLFIAVFASWAICLAWFGPRLLKLVSYGYEWPTRLVLLFYIGFIAFAWLYGLYNIWVVTFAAWNRTRRQRSWEQVRARTALLPANTERVAILYTTCNDISERSLESCVAQQGIAFRVYILDDSSDPICQARVDAFAMAHPNTVQVVRRPDRRGFKAGNMNHALTHVVTEKYFAIADADEILPPDFLVKLVPIMEADPTCAFTQANHRADPDAPTKLARDMGIGIDLHWEWYQPLRNDFGFVMFLGHGALLRRSVWEAIGGFPEIVSEDLAFAIKARELGYRGRFVEDVVCFEQFPETVRAFRVRHMKWTRGTCEFLHRMGRDLVRSKRISTSEKLDILFPTLNLPLTLLYFLFMLNANIALPYLFGVERTMTIELGGHATTFATMGLFNAFNMLYSADFFLITVLTLVAPVLCFIIGLAHRPVRMVRFLAQSTALYAALGTLSSIGVVAYLFSGKAQFLVTGDTASKAPVERPRGLRQAWRVFIDRSHPDSALVVALELIVGLSFAFLAASSFQPAFMGLCLAFLLLPLMHFVGWSVPAMRIMRYGVFGLVVIGLALGSLSLVGMQSMFFGYGFHF